MLTGGSELIAATMARQIGLTDYRADMLPRDRQEKVKRLQAQGKVVAMVGDGIDDTPALAQADVGIAIGTGTDIAIGGTPITLVKDDLSGIMKAKKSSKAVVKSIREDLFLALVYNVIGIPIAADALYPVFGVLLPPMLGILAMSFSSVSVIDNTLRPKRFDS